MSAETTTPAPAAPQILEEYVTFLSSIRGSKTVVLPIAPHDAPETVLRLLTQASERLSRSITPLPSPAGEVRFTISRRSGPPDYEAHDRGGRRPHWVHVGPRLKALREEANLSQKQFAALTKEVDPTGVGLSSYSINRHEQSMHAPRPTTVTLLAATLSRALGRRITEDKLRLSGQGGLGLYLENIRTTQRRTKEDFYARGLGIPVARADVLLAGRDEWTVPELRAVGQRYLEAADLIQSVVLGVIEESVRESAASAA